MNSALVLKRRQGRARHRPGHKGSDLVARISALPAHTQAVLRLSTHWLGIAVKTDVHALSKLDPCAILDALVAGKSVSWEDWTLRTSPPRPSIDPHGGITWSSAIWVSSTKGFSPFPCLDHENVEDACRFILKREARAYEHSLIAFHDET